MTLVELQEALGERIIRIKDTSLTPEERKLENQISSGIVAVAKQMINNADVILRADKLAAEGKLKDDNITKIVGGV